LRFLELFARAFLVSLPGITLAQTNNADAQKKTSEAVTLKTDFNSKHLHFALGGVVLDPYKIDDSDVSMQTLERGDDIEGKFLIEVGARRRWAWDDLRIEEEKAAPRRVAEVNAELRVVEAQLQQLLRPPESAPSDLQQEVVVANVPTLDALRKRKDGLETEKADAKKQSMKQPPKTAELPWRRDRLTFVSPCEDFSFIEFETTENGKRDFKLGGIAGAVGTA